MSGESFIDPRLLRFPARWERLLLLFKRKQRVAFDDRPGELVYKVLRGKTFVLRWAGDPHA